MDLFEQQADDGARPPLAWRMRPRSLDEYVGQSDLVGSGAPLRRMLELGRVESSILFGPPGSGKTALAHLIAAAGGYPLRAVNAVTAGVADLRTILADAQGQFRAGRRTVVFIDEIHRFNKIQQSALLPDVEQGCVVLIGASTENPFFAIIPALASRLRLYELKPLTADDMHRIIRGALTDRERGLGAHAAELTPDAEEELVRSAAGDARRALNALEIAVLTTASGPDGVIRIDRRAIADAAGRRPVIYDRGDERYDTVSAFIKSMRGSDPDAALYWLAKLIAGGEDPRYIARRVVICASEDVGAADPEALHLAVDALTAVEAIGLPEARLALAQAVVYIAAAPKSNSVICAIDAALADVERGPALAVPEHLKDAHYSGADRLGRGVGYRYPHSYPGGWVKQDYLPEPRSYYNPGGRGAERELARRLQQRGSGAEERPAAADSDETPGPGEAQRS